jgi:hypothetical protein
MKLLLCALYQRFELTREGESGQVRELFAFTMPPSHLRVRIGRRSADADGRSATAAIGIGSRAGLTRAFAQLG